MDDTQVFETTLSQYRDAYIQVGLDQQPPNALDEPRTQILNSLARLEDLVNSETEEIRQFPETAVTQRNTTRALVSGASGLQEQRTRAKDELERIDTIVGLPPPPPNYQPLYTRLGIIGGLVVILLLIRSTRVVA